MMQVDATHPFYFRFCLQMVDGSLAQTAADLKRWLDEHTKKYTLTAHHMIGSRMAYVVTMAIADEAVHFKLRFSDDLAQYDRYYYAMLNYVSSDNGIDMARAVGPQPNKPIV